MTHQEGDLFVDVGPSLTRFTCELNVTWYEGWDISGAFNASTWRWQTEGSTFHFGDPAASKQEAINVPTQQIAVADNICTISMDRKVPPVSSGGVNRTYNNGGGNVTVQTANWQTGHIYTDADHPFGPDKFVEVYQRWDIENDGLAPSSWSSDYPGGASTGEIDFPDFFSYDPTGPIAHHNRWAVLDANETGNKVNDTTNADDDGWHCYRCEWNGTTNLISWYVDGVFRASIDGDLLTPDLPKNPHFLRLSMNVGGKYRNSQWCYGGGSGCNVGPELDVPGDHYEYQIKYIKVGDL